MRMGWLLIIRFLFVDYSQVRRRCGLRSDPGDDRCGTGTGWWGSTAAPTTTTAGRRDGGVDGDAGAGAGFEVGGVGGGLDGEWGGDVSGRASDVLTVSHRIVSPPHYRPLTIDHLASASNGHALYPTFYPQPASAFASSYMPHLTITLVYASTRCCR